MDPQSHAVMQPTCMPYCMSGNEGRLSQRAPGVPVQGLVSCPSGRDSSVCRVQTVRQRLPGHGFPRGREGSGRGSDPDGGNVGRPWSLEALTGRDAWSACSHGVHTLRVPTKDVGSGAVYETGAGRHCPTIVRPGSRYGTWLVLACPSFNHRANHRVERSKRSCWFSGRCSVCPSPR